MVGPSGDGPSSDMVLILHVAEAAGQGVGVVDAFAVVGETEVIAVVLATHLVHEVLKGQVEVGSGLGKMGMQCGLDFPFGEAAQGRVGGFP